MIPFQRIDGELFAEQVPLTSIAETYGTPTFVYSQAAIESAYHEFASAFESHPTDICYAVKANSNIAVLQVLANCGAGFDIVSGGELMRVLKAGGDPAKVVFSGVGKQDWEIELGLQHAIACFNIESASELQRISKAARKLGTTASISVRVNPDVDPKTHPYIATGLKENKFGVSPAEAIAIYREAHASECLNVVGIDCHIGSQITELKPFLDALARILELTDELEQNGIVVQHIDLGGGIGIRYRDETPLDLHEFASAILQAMSGRSQKLMFEPGRLIVAEAGVLITRVVTCKTNDDKNFAVVDAAMNDLIRPALYGAWQEVTPVFQSDQSDSQAAQLWDIVGPVCETGDFLAKQRQLALFEEQLLAIHCTGAYGFVMSSNYNTRGRAAEVLIDGLEHFCVRQRETIEDQLDLESLRPPK